MDKLKILTKFFKDRGIEIEEGSDYDSANMYTLGDTWQVKIEDFPHNCGMRVLTGLEGTDKKTSQTNQVALLEYVKWKLGATKDKPGLLIYTINANQKRLESVFERAEFKLMWEGVNPHHGPKHKIKMFGYDLHNYKKDEVDALPSLR